MHSSRMRTTHSSSRQGGGSPHPPHPRDQAPPQDPAPSPLEQGPGTPRRRDQALPCGQTHIRKHITLPQTSFAGGNEPLKYP